MQDDLSSIWSVLLSTEEQLPCDCKELQALYGMNLTRHSQPTLSLLQLFIEKKRKQKRERFNMLIILNLAASLSFNNLILWSSAQVQKRKRCICYGPPNLQELIQIIKAEYQC